MTPQEAYEEIAGSTADLRAQEPLRVLRALVYPEIDRPKHYNAHPSGVEAIDVCEQLTFNVGNAVKYLWRCGLKGDAVEDARKAAWYLRRANERDEEVDGVEDEGLELIGRVVAASEPESVLKLVLYVLFISGEGDADERLTDALALVEREIARLA